MFWKRIYQATIIIFGLWLLSQLVATLGVEILWFQEVHTLQVFWLKLLTQSVLWLVAAGLPALYLLMNLALAKRLQYPLADQKWVMPLPASGSLKLTRLLILSLTLALGTGYVLLNCFQIAFSYWQPSWGQADLIPELPQQLSGKMLWQVIQDWQVHSWGAIPAIGFALVLLLLPQLVLTATATLLSLLLGFIVSANWSRVLQALHPTSFQLAEPVLHQDVGFYVFVLPTLELMQFWLLGFLVFGLLAVLLLYVLSGDSLSQGYFPGFSKAQLRHLKGLVGLLLLAIAAAFWLGRYRLLFSENGASYGAGYTDANIQLPVLTVLSVMGVLLGLLCLQQAILPGRRQQGFRSLLIVLCLYAGISVSLSTLLPEGVQYLIVRPNELLQEKPYIQRTIELTRRAFNLEKAEARTFIPQGGLTVKDLEANALTVRNIRLWDQRPLLETNRQLQQIRLYYRFPDADLDRYTIPQDASEANLGLSSSQTPNSGSTLERRQVLIAARELDFTAVPSEAQTWVNEHLIYTHGYGFTVSPVNRVGAGGLPEYFVKDIGGIGDGALTTSSQAIRDSIPIENPRIYYGELTNTYVTTGTQVKELDYPSGEENIYNVYDGQGGIPIGTSLWRRILFARYLNDGRLLLTRDFLPETKLLFRRNINQRIRTIAPFLRYDASPYLVAVNIEKPQSPQSAANRQRSSEPSHLYWIVDAYTVSNHFPYSDPGAEKMNYIRNSVKVVVDAYNGSVKFYIADPTDPIVQTWATVFPGLLQPLDSMPEALRNHIRYPSDMFAIQSRQLMTYHMTDAQVFYNREDLWQIPNEIYGSEARQVKPYYLITSLPSVPFEEFILLMPYTPNQRSNLTAWFAARSDGENYGKLLLYEFPKQTLVYGPEQIEARINQDPVISQQISLWNRQGSRAIQGNLLIIPIERSLLYVEPIYLEATENSLPTLVRVVVAYENQIVMAPTLERALQAIFQAEKPVTPTIVRPVEEQG